MDMSLFKEYGLLGLLMGSVITLLFFVVKWTLSTTKDILKQAEKERECWRETINSVNVQIQAHNITAKDFHESVCEAHKFQREEHSKMIASLNEINNSLVRINGYKH
jgi:hypothetical protein